MLGGAHSGTGTRLRVSNVWITRFNWHELSRRPGLNGDLDEIVRCYPAHTPIAEFSFTTAVIRRPPCARCHAAGIRRTPIYTVVNLVTER